jgi:hypothetical protein
MQLEEVHGVASVVCVHEIQTQCFSMLAPVC